MTGDDAVQRCATALLEAYETGRAVDPPRTMVEGLDLERAYAVQRAQVQRWEAAGARVRGHKVGLTSLAMQRQLGVDQPDYGHLLDRMFVPEGSVVGLDRFIQPRVEPEVGFVLRERVEGPGVTAADVLRATAYVVPALEIIDSRVRDWDITLVDTIADNASSAAVVLGGHPAAPGSVDLRYVGCTLLHNGRVAGTGTGADVLGNPVSAVVWLANVLGEGGLALEAGAVVLPGSCTAAVALEPQDTVTAVFSGLGSVTVSFGGERTGAPVSP